jgi:hypothetical protein
MLIDVSSGKGTLFGDLKLYDDTTYLDVLLGDMWIRLAWSAKTVLALLQAPMGTMVSLPPKCIRGVDGKPLPGWDCGLMLYFVEGEPNKMLRIRAAPTIGCSSSFFVDALVEWHRVTAKLIVERLDTLRSMRFSITCHHMACDVIDAIVGDRCVYATTYADDNVERIASLRSDADCFHVCVVHWDGHTAAYVIGCGDVVVTLQTHMPQYASPKIWTMDLGEFKRALVVCATTGVVDGEYVDAYACLTHTARLLRLDHTRDELSFVAIEMLYPHVPLHSVA